MNSFISYNTLIVLLGTTLLGANAGLVGSFTVLRGRALIGDVLAHAALPGLCLAFLWLGQRSLPAMLTGALASGLACILLMTFLRRWTRVKDDAVMGVVRSVFLGAGIVLISYIQNQTVAGSKAGFDSYILGKTAGLLADDVRLFVGVSTLSLSLILLLYKEFQLASFDPGFARVQGWPALLLDNAQMALAAITVVIALPAVGAILVTAMLILPGATMRFWTDRLSTLLIGAAVIGGAVGGLGTLMSAQFSLLPAGPIIILVGTAVFLTSMLGAPRRGLLARAAANRRFRNELLLQTLLRRIYESAEGRRSTAVHRSRAELMRSLGWSTGTMQRIVHAAVLQQLVSERATPSTHDYELSLTSQGAEYVAKVVRGYRLWQRFLTEYPDQSCSLVDLDVQHVDEYLPPDIIRALERKLVAEGRLPLVAEGRAS
ncbi:MAG: metal ABC transporter permease [Planctomycetia bacterium]|nr:metal ABC transporter permease [Planctomycetia bacterium]